MTLTPKHMNMNISKCCRAPTNWIGISASLPNRGNYYCDDCRKKCDRINWTEEMDKCTKSPYYFFTTYWKVKGTPFKTNWSEKEFNKIMETLGTGRKLFYMKGRGRR